MPTAEQLIREIGGGLPAVVIVFLALTVAALARVVVVLYRQNNTLQDRNLSIVREMGAENRDLLTQTNTTTNANTEVMRQVLQMEARR